MSKTILVVDDNHDLTNSTAFILKMWGYDDVIAAYSGQQALDLTVGRPLHAAMVDIRMPAMNGYSVASVLRKRYGRRLLLIAATGYNRLLDPRSELFDLVIIKPFDLDILKMAIGAHNCGIVLEFTTTITTTIRL